MAEIVIILRTFFAVVILTFFSGQICAAQNTNWEFETPTDSAQTPNPYTYNTHAYHRVSSELSADFDDAEVKLKFTLIFQEPSDTFIFLITMQAPTLYIRSVESIKIDGQTSGTTFEPPPNCEWEQLKKIADGSYENNCMYAKVKRGWTGLEGEMYYSGLSISVNDNIEEFLEYLSTEKTLKITLNTASAFDTDMEKPAVFVFNLADRRAPASFAEFKSSTFKTEAGLPIAGVDDLRLSAEDALVLKAANNGDLDAQVRFAKMLYQSNTDQAINLAQDWLLYAASAGSAAAQEELGMMYFTGVGGRRDLALAYAALSLADMNGEYVSEASLARLMQEMSTQDLLKAQGYIESCLKFGLDDCIF